MRVSAFEIDGERHLFAEGTGGVTDLGVVDRFFKGESIPRASAVVQTDALVVEDEGVRS